MQILTKIYVGTLSLMQQKDSKATKGGIDALQGEEK